MLFVACAGIGGFAIQVTAQVPVAPNRDHAAMLADADPKLAANKRLVYDFWREVFEAGQIERADDFLTESYIQHNPNVPTGRAAFKAFVAKFTKPGAVEARVKAPLVAIVADGDYVVLTFAQGSASPDGYASTWFDMFRIDHGKIAEHWDPTPKTAAAAMAAVPAVALDAATLRRYVGTFEVTAVTPDVGDSAAGMMLDVSLRDGQLYFDLHGPHVKTSGATALAAQGKDEFLDGDGDHVSFSGDAKGNAAKAVVRAGDYAFSAVRKAD
jgi:predicted SnoaL-like aldol condensation-catalyzing enzyme